MVVYARRDPRGSCCPADSDVEQVTRQIKLENNLLEHQIPYDKEVFSRVAA